MKPLYVGEESYYKKMLDLQEQLRKSEEERIRLEERFNLLVLESRNRHQECINRLRMRYVEYLEDQRIRDERNNRLLGNLDKIDNSLALMSAKTERLNTLRKQYEAYLLRTYGQNQRPSGSVTADSGLESQNDRDIPASPIVLTTTKAIQSTTKSPTNYKTMNNNNETVTIPIVSYNYKLPNFSWLSTENSNDVSKKLTLPSYLDTSYKCPINDIKLEEKSDCLLRDFTIKPIKSTTDSVSTAERNLERYLNQIKQMHKDFEKCELEQSADEAEQNTSGDLLNVSLSEDNFESPSVEEEATKEKLRLTLARQAFANPLVSTKSQDIPKTPPNSFDNTLELTPKPIDEVKTSSPKHPESMTSFKDRSRHSELTNSHNNVNLSFEPKLIEESTTFSETIGPVNDRYAPSEFSSLQNESKPKTIEETTKFQPTFTGTMNSFKNRLKRLDFKSLQKQSKPKEDIATKSSTPFSEAIGSLREKFKRTDFVNNNPITSDSFEDAFAKLTRMKEPRGSEETIEPVITRELPTPPAEEAEIGSSSEHENDGIEDDYDDTVDIDSWMPDDVEPESQHEVKRKDDILDLPRRKLESIEEVDHAEDEDVEEQEIEAKTYDAKDGAVTEEIVEDEKKEDTTLRDTQDLAVEQPASQHEENIQENSNVNYESQEQYPSEEVADPNATSYNDQGDQQYVDQQHYEQDTTVKQQYETTSDYYEQGDPQLQYQYSNDPNQQYAYDPNVQYEGYEGQYTGYEQYQYDPSQYDPNQYDPNQQYQQYTDQTYVAGYQDTDQIAHYSDPNQAYDYSQAYVEDVQTYEQHQQPTDDKTIDSNISATVEPTSVPTQNPLQDKLPKKKKDPINAILDSDSESFIERNPSNTESDFDFN